MTSTPDINLDSETLRQLRHRLDDWAHELGFQQLAVSDTDLESYKQKFQAWIADGQHGEMEYMARHGSKRYRPAELVPGTTRIISVRMDYWPENAEDPLDLLEQPERAIVSRYALGRDYHKVIRQRLQTLADRISGEIGPFGYRAFTDSAPVLEKPLAEKAGLGWIGKHTNLLNKNAGSWFFLGELFTDLPLPVDAPASEHCGSCRRCIDICPTDAITGPFQLDARRCISYLTIELHGPIPLEFRKPIGNRIFGCDDCQAICPWNKFARATPVSDFSPRQNLDSATLVELFAWTESEFLGNTEGSAIRRLGHERWLRNIAVALGNAPGTQATLDALKSRPHHPSELVREHVAWALEQHGGGVTC